MDDFQWEGTNSNTLELEMDVFGEWKMYFGPALKEEENIIDFTIHEYVPNNNSWGIIVGVVSSKHKRRNGCLGVSKYGWGYISTGQKKHFFESHGVDYTKLKFNRAGNVVRMIYSYHTKTLSFEVNGKKCGVAWENVGDNIYASISANAKKLKISAEIIHTRDAEEAERINFVSEMTDLKIPLKNKTLNVWKPFFAQSSIPRLSSEETKSYDGLKGEELSIDEDVLLPLLLSNPFEISEARVEELVEYFIFFKKLGMRSDIDFLLQVIERRLSKKKFTEVFDVFKCFALRFEKEEIQNWFLEERQEEMVPNKALFRHILSTLLFHSLKSKRKEVMMVRNNSPNNTPLDIYRDLQGLGMVLKYTNPKFELDLPISEDERFSQALEVDTHTKETHDRVIKPVKPIEKKLEFLWNNREKFSNLCLNTDDGGVFKVQKQVLCWKLNFLYRMISFGGAEAEEMESKGEISLIDIGKTETEALLELVYTGTVRTDDLAILISLYSQLEKFVETRLMSRVHLLIRTNVEDSSIGAVKRALRKVGWMLKTNQNLHSKIVGILEKKIEKGTIKKLISKSFQNKKKN